jgi:hypothetical protein
MVRLVDDSDEESYESDSDSDNEQFCETCGRGNCWRDHEYDSD